MTTNELTIEFAQRTQPWTVKYSDAVIRASRSGVTHILASHNVLHAAKTVGKLATVFERCDHTGHPPNDDDCEVIKAMAADLLTEALRLANLFGFDLATELVRRVEEKNSINILNVGKT